MPPTYANHIILLGSSFAVFADTADATPCTSTIFIQPTIAHGPTSTAYPSTFTITESIDCGGCGDLATIKGRVLVVSFIALTLRDFSLVRKLTCGSLGSHLYHDCIRI
jgi:hypothetical protein